MKKIVVSIVIVNYKVKDKLFECIDSIFKSKPKSSFEIIVVDNDEESVIEKELLKFFPDVKYIKSPSNLGYGGGNNLGAKYAKGEYLFILNPDTLVFKNTIDELVNFLTKNRDVGIVSPMLVNKSGEPFVLQGTSELTPLKGIVCLSFIEKMFPKNRFSREYWLKDWNHTVLKEVEVCPGTAFMISRKLFDEINGFDEKFFLYFEEDDVSNRVRKLNYRIYILEKAKIFHEVGASTKQLISSSSIFAKSRFLYFKKHYGIVKALLVESFLRINKVSASVLFLLLLAFLLRIYNLSNGMTFIGDQGWFYLSARDLLMDGKIPLVGITSSHTWLHQGPLWTYMLAIVLFLFNFNPLAGGYLTVLFGTLTTFLMYKLGSLLFSEKVGIISAALLAVSPLVIFFDRMPFDPGPIPFFTVLFFFAVARWVRGSINYFPFILLFLALLYNLELATFTLFFPSILIFIYGFVKKKEWVSSLFNKRIISYSLIALAVPMLPVIVYDFSHGFKQTFVFAGWTLYKPFSFLIKHSSGDLFTNLKVVLDFFANSLQKLIFQLNLTIAMLIFGLSIALLLLLVFKRKRIEVEDSKSVLFFMLFFSLGGILVNQTPSDAYLPILFPFIFFTIALFFEFLLGLKILKYITVILLFIIISLNAYSSFENSFNYDLKYRMGAVNKIINLVGNKKYNLVGKGEGSWFESFTMNYEYLLWWKGYPPTHENVKLKIIVSETKKGIVVSKKYD